MGPGTPDAESCAHGLTESAVQLTSDAVAFYAAGGPIASVVVHSDDAITVTARLHGEDGHSRIESLTLRLSLAGTRLERADSPGSHYRCTENGDGGS